MHLDQKSPKSWATLVLLGLAQFMVILDITVVNVALPSIAEDLAFAEGDLQWVITAYVLFTGGLLMLGGRATDLFGRRRIFLAGLTTFTAASLASGLASSPEALVGARAVQGFGAAMLTPSALSIVTTTYAGSQRTAALAAWSVNRKRGCGRRCRAGWGPDLGSRLGMGVLHQCAGRRAHRDRLCSGSCRMRHRPRSGSGSTSSVPSPRLPGLVVLLYGIEGANEHGWGSARTIGLLLASVVLLADFAGLERRVQRPDRPADDLAQPPARRGDGLDPRRDSPAGRGLLPQHALPAGRPRLVGARDGACLPAAGRGHRRRRERRQPPDRADRPAQPRRARARLVAGGAGLLVLAPDVASYGTDILPGFLVLGFGVGLVFPAGSIAAMSNVADDSGRSGLRCLITTGHELGAAFGVAASSAVATAASTFVAGYATASSPSPRLPRSSRASRSLRARARVRVSGRKQAPVVDGCLP